MGEIINSKSKLELFKRTYKNKYFVDKSKILCTLNQLVGTDQQYICITRPRRFGKTVMTNLLSAYYSKDMDTKEIFDKMNISEYPGYEEHLNQHNVISLNMSEFPENCTNYKDYISYHSQSIKKELIKKYTDCTSTEELSLWKMFSEIYQQTKEGFIFIIDEWDSYFHSDFYTKEGSIKYLTFLKNLLKDKSYADLVYMTGVLPIRKYSSGSELNMFDEFYFPTDTIYDTYFGFTEDEVLELCERNKKNGGTIQYEELAEWYNGYYTCKGNRLYNPRSINKALNQNKVKDYWTETGPGNEILSLIEHDVDAVKEDFIKLVSGQKIELESDEFTTDLSRIESKEEVYSAMVVYGFLSYYDGQLSIPNKEIMRKFQKVLRDKRMGYVAELVKNSNIMLQATLNGDTEKMSEMLSFVHDAEIPILQYNDENSLACIVSLIYLSARNKYRIEREEMAGKGLADFIFHPLQEGDPAIILELKVDDTPEHAIEQIIEKKYYTKLCTMKEGKVVQNGAIMLVGLTYDKKKKEHHCLVKNLEEETISE